MRIKLLTASLLLGFKNPLPEGAVVESEEAPNVSEFTALITVGYAKETTAKVTHKQDVETIAPVVVDEPVTTYVDPEKAAIIEQAIGEVLEHNAADAIELMDTLDPSWLPAALQQEAAGKNRKTVLEAITAKLATE